MVNQKYIDPIIIVAQIDIIGTYTNYNAVAYIGSVATTGEVRAVASGSLRTPLG